MPAKDSKLQNSEPGARSLRPLWAISSHGPSAGLNPES
jgi:hypothetical protein